jgi:hypothetical protein
MTSPRAITFDSAVLLSVGGSPAAPCRAFLPVRVTAERPLDTVEAAERRARAGVPPTPEIVSVRAIFHVEPSMPIEIQLTRGAVALVDEEDAHLAGLYWHLDGSGYAARLGLRMHRVILGARRGQEVDHANGNRLDNRRANLRFADRSENSRNRGLRRGKSLAWLKGVYKHPKPGCARWQASIFHGGRLHYLGLFVSPVKAGMAYDAAAIRLFGEFACINGLRAEDRAVANRCLLSQKEADRLAELDLVATPRLRLGRELVEELGLDARKTLEAEASDAFESEEGASDPETRKFVPADRWDEGGEA